MWFPPSTQMIPSTCFLEKITPIVCGDYLFLAYWSDCSCECKSLSLTSFADSITSRLRIAYNIRNSWVEKRFPILDFVIRIKVLERTCLLILSPLRFVNKKPCVVSFFTAGINLFKSLWFFIFNLKVLLPSDLAVLKSSSRICQPRGFFSFL